MTWPAPAATGTPAPSVTCSPASGSTFNKGTVSVTCTATNACGTNACSFDVTVVDNQAPVITRTGAASVTLCTGASYTELGAVANDNCDATSAATVGGDTVNTAVVGIYIVRYNKTDSSANAAAEVTRTVMVNAAPTISCPGNVTNNTAPGLCTAVVSWSAPGVTGTPAPDVTCAPASGSTFNKGVNTVTCTASNECGMASCSFSVVVEDHEAPVFNCGQHETVSCMQGWGFTFPIITDNCDGLISTTAITNSTTTNFTCGYTFEATRIWQVTDSSANTTYCTQVVTYVDFIAPTITSCPMNMMVPCLSGVPSPDISLVTAANTFDPCDMSTPVVVHFSDVTNGVNPIVITRTYRAYDACSNAAQCVQTITVPLDATGPVITLNGPATTNVCMGDSYVELGATATDACDGSVLVVVSGDTVNTAVTGTYVVRFNASDTHANAAIEVTRTVTVGTAPTITCPGNVTNNTAPGLCTAVVSWPAPGATGTRAPTVTCAPASGSTFNKGANTVTCMASNECGMASCSFSVVVEDHEPPVFNCGQHETVSCMQGWGFTFPIITDNCDGLISTTAITNSTTTNFTCGYTFEATRIWQVTDSSANTTYCTQVVTYVDFIAPTITGCPADVTVPTLASVPVANPALVAATNQFDPCDLSVPLVVHFSDATNGAGPFTITRTYRAYDACSNYAQCVQTITATVAVSTPIIVCPAADLVQCFAGILVPDPAQAMSSSGTGSLTNSFVGDSYSTNGYVITVTRTYKVTDGVGSMATCTQNFTVQDTTPPVITCAGNVAVQCPADVPPCPANLAQFLVAGGTASDLCDGSLTYTCADGPLVGGACGGTIARTHSVTDPSGNSASCQQVITVHDTIPPVLTCPPVVAALSTSTNGTNVIYSTPVATDNCTASPAVACVPASGSFFAVGTTTVTCSAVDDCANTNSCSFAVLVSYCHTVAASVNAAVPDGSINGLASTLTVASPIGALTDVNVTLNLSGGWNGDLYAYLVHGSGFSVLLNRAGRRATEALGYSDAGFNSVTLDDQAADDIHNYRVTLTGSHLIPLGGPLAGAWQADGRATDPASVLDTDPRTELLSSFNGLNPNGDWVLFIADSASGDISTLAGWSLQLCGTLGVAPSVVVPPASQSVGCGSNVTFTAEFAGTRPMGFQWYHGGTPIPGATGSNLTLLAVLPPAAGQYSVRGSNAFATTLSVAATLAVVENPPVITEQPQSRTNNVGSTAAFGVMATSCGPVSYQWCLGGTPLPAETNASLSVANVQLIHGGSYLVKISNTGGTVTSAVAVLTVNRPPFAMANGAATTEGVAVALRVAKLLANDSDPDGDVITLIGVSSASTNGGSVVLAADMVSYTPRPGFTGSDRYTYTISDGRGGTATGDVEVMVVSGALPSLNQILVQPVPGGFRVRFGGIPGHAYRVQRSTDLNTWGTVAALTAPLHGTMEYIDLTGLPAAFYRTLSP